MNLAIGHFLKSENKDALELFSDAMGYFVEHHELGLFEVEETMAVMAEAGLTVDYDADGLTGRGLYIGRKNG